MKLEKERKRQRGRRLSAALLSFTLLMGLAPAFGPTAHAADWMQEYLDKLVSWGVMRGDIDGNLRPNDNITRAEFVTLVNRAYGYDELGPTPFTDVSSGDWYFEDIGIAYTEGYFGGTSETTASPGMNLTREETAVLLGRNMMLQTEPGEVTEFSDSRDLSEWSRGLVRAVSKTGVINGYPDGTFRPQQLVTRGEVAVMLVRALGTPIQEPGEHTLGNVYGNVTITTAGVKLKDTTIAGDLYLTGGIGLGDLLLQNVTVLGKIVVSGAGESHKGDLSITMRNVTANEMLVDSLDKQFVTIRTDGNTEIWNTTVRTPAFLEDVTGEGKGLKLIEVRGEPGLEVQLAGGIKEVINYTPNSNLKFTIGSADKVTVDEKATNSTVTIDRGAYIKELNLDVAAHVMGGGDIAHLNVNAPGVTCDPLPDTITIRPGLTANIYGGVMDAEIAREHSMDPRILAGYPNMKNVAPKSAEIVFSTNKRGTVYWAISGLSEGSVGEEDLLSPPTYGGNIIKSGSLRTELSKTEYRAKVDGLLSDGSYYVTAMLVDDRGERSPIKVISFTTPDDSVPKFASGYPTADPSDQDIQITAMPTKNCILYWAVLTKGSTAPTVEDFRAGAISGNKGSGSMEVTKNVEAVFTANGMPLGDPDILKEYDVYLCLIDANGAKNSGVKKLTVKMKDGTPPYFVSPPVTPVKDIKPTSVGVTATLSEKGTIYWAIVPEGEPYPVDGRGNLMDLTDQKTKVYVAGGNGALDANPVSAQGNKETKFNISKLEKQTAYDMYYVGMDEAGIFTHSVEKITIRTQDKEGPTVTISFSKPFDKSETVVLPDTDVELRFSESIQDADGESFLELYQASRDGSKTPSERNAAKARLSKLLEKDVCLMSVGAQPPDEKVYVKAAGEEHKGAWIDYSAVKVSMEDGETVLTFEHGNAINLSSGGEYYFHIQDITDAAKPRTNAMQAKDMGHFKAALAKVNLKESAITELPTKNGVESPADMVFRMYPASTESVEDKLFHDIYLWTDRTMDFDLFVRILDEKNNKVITSGPAVDEGIMKDVKTSADLNGWFLLGSYEYVYGSDQKEKLARSVYSGIPNKDKTSLPPRLNSLKENYVYEYVISLTSLDKNIHRDTWSGKVSVEVRLPAGEQVAIQKLPGNVEGISTQCETSWKEQVKNGNITPVGVKEDFEVSYSFQDTKAPGFFKGYPEFDTGDSFANMNLYLDRPGTVYWAVAPVGKIKAYTPNGIPIFGAQDYDAILTTQTAAGDLIPQFPPDSGGVYTPLIKGDGKPETWPKLTAPDAFQIYKGDFNNDRIKKGSKSMGNNAENIPVTGLEAETVYYAYFVTKGQSQVFSDPVCFMFWTKKVEKPKITLTDNSPSVSFKTSTSSVLDYCMVPYRTAEQVSFLMANFEDYAVDKYKTEYESKITTNDKMNDGDDSDFTVLDALLTSYLDGTSDSQRYTVFDVYAQPLQAGSGIRASVADYIRGEAAQDANPPVAKGNISLTDVPGFVNFSKTEGMKVGVSYYCLSVAHNVQSTEDAFRGIKNFRLPDVIPPTVMSVNTQVTTVKNSKGKVVYPDYMTEDPGQFTYSGNVTITFDKPVYFMEENSSAKAVLMTENFTGPDQGDTVYFHNHVNIPNIGQYKGKEKKAATDSFTLYFTDIHIGDLIVMFDGGDIASSGSTAAGEKLSIKFQMSQDGKPGPAGPVNFIDGPRFVGIWNGKPIKTD